MGHLRDRVRGIGWVRIDSPEIADTAKEHPKVACSTCKATDSDWVRKGSAEFAYVIKNEFDEAQLSDLRRRGIGTLDCAHVVSSCDGPFVLMWKNDDDMILVK